MPSCVLGHFHGFQFPRIFNIFRKIFLALISCFCVWDSLTLCPMLPWIFKPPKLLGVQMCATMPRILYIFSRRNLILCVSIFKSFHFLDSIVFLKSFILIYYVSSPSSFSWSSTDDCLAWGPSSLKLESYLYNVSGVHLLTFRTLCSLGAPREAKFGFIVLCFN